MDKETLQLFKDFNDAEGILETQPTPTSFILDQIMKYCKETNTDINVLINRIINESDGISNMLIKLLMEDEPIVENVKMNVVKSYYIEYPSCTTNGMQYSINIVLFIGNMAFNTFYTWLELSRRGHNYSFEKILYNKILYVIIHELSHTNEFCIPGCGFEEMINIVGEYAEYYNYLNAYLMFRYSDQKGLEIAKNYELFDKDILNYYINSHSYPNVYSSNMYAKSILRITNYYFANTVKMQLVVLLTNIDIGFSILPSNEGIRVYKEYILPVTLFKLDNSSDIIIKFLITANGEKEIFGSEYLVKSLSVFDEDEANRFLIDFGNSNIFTEIEETTLRMTESFDANIGELTINVTMDLTRRPVRRVMNNV